MSTISGTISHTVYYGAGTSYSSPLTVTNTGAVITSSNTASAAVAGTGGGLLINYGTIVNEGSLDGAVRIAGAGGTGTVLNSGFVQGYFFGVKLGQPGIVTNAGSGTIQAVGDNAAAVIFTGTGAGTLTNQGVLLATSSGSDGVSVESSAGGEVTNSGGIKASGAGVYMRETGLVTNIGSILSTGGSGLEFAGSGTLINSGSIGASAFGQLGVDIGGAGSTIINTGTIQGYFTAIDMGGSNAVVVNSSVIDDVTTPFIAYQADVELALGGSFTNTQSGFVSNGVNLADGGGENVSATVVNAGTITGGIALNLNSNTPGGEGFPVPAYYGSGTVFLSGTVSGASFNPFPISFGGTNALLVLEHGFKINGVVDGVGNKYPHTVELAGSAGASVTLDFNPSSFTNFGTVEFAPGNSNYGTIALAGSADIPATITNFTGPHDVVDLQFISDTSNNATVQLNPINNQLTITGDNGSATLQLGTAGNYTGVQFTAVPDAAGTGTDVQTVCFCSGTRIRTDHGDVPVESLGVGDNVVLVDGGTSPIVWIGQGCQLATRGRRTAATPVIVRKGALADNVPYCDLRITKAHSLYLDDVLIPVEFLVNHRSIVWDDRAQEVPLYHVELEQHGVLIANGALAESYRDDGNRWLFNNANSGWLLPPKPTCKPVVTGGPVVDAIWRRLLDRSGPRAGVPLTDEPDLHLLADGHRLDAVWCGNGVYEFGLRAVPNMVRIMSRAAIPQEFGHVRDARPLGVALLRVAIWQGAQVRTIESDDPMLRDGFHRFERCNGFRWTCGDAVLPRAAFAGFSGPLRIFLTIANTTSYLDEGERLDAA